MRGSRRALFVVLFAGAAMAFAHLACSSFSGGATGNESDAAVLPDTTSDAASDARDARPAAAFCVAYADAAVCADFDEGDPVNFHFTERAGDVSVDDASSVSPPGAMHAVATDAKSAYLRGQATAAPLLSKQHLSFNTYQGALGGGGGLIEAGYIGGLQEETTVYCRFDIESFGDSARLVVRSNTGDGGAGIFETFTFKTFPPAGRWTRVELDVATAGSVTSTVKATVVVDGVVAVDTVATRCPALAPNPFLYVGLMDGRAGEARYDNVLFDGR